MENEESMKPEYHGLKCFYCGDSAESRDHVVARKARIKKKLKKQLHAEAMQTFGRNTVPACHPCNRLKNSQTLEEFRIELTAHAVNNHYSNPRRMRLHRLAVRLSPFRFVFYGERSPDGKFPELGTSQPFRYRWKMKAPRNTGDEAIRIEECAKRGPFREVLAGLMGGR